MLPACMFACCKCFKFTLPTVVFVLASTAAVTVVAVDKPYAFVFFAIVVAVTAVGLIKTENEVGVGVDNKNDSRY